jgi:hypothetical protein
MEGKRMLQHTGTIRKMGFRSGSGGNGETETMAVFMVQLADGQDRVVEADVAGRTLAGEIVLESATLWGDWEQLVTYQAGDVRAVFRREPVDGGGYGWIAQPSTGSWWCY